MTADDRWLRSYDHWLTRLPEHAPECGDGEYPCSECNAPVGCEDCSWLDLLDADGRLIGCVGNDGRRVQHIDDAGREVIAEIACRGTHCCARCAEDG